MGQRKFLPLKISEVLTILQALGFSEARCKGSHAQYVRPACANMPKKVVTVALAVSEFAEFLMSSMVSQSGFTAKQFYGATAKTAKKA